MSINLQNAIEERSRGLSDEQRRKVLAFIEEITGHSLTTIWGRLDDRLNKLPPEAIADLPSDASENLDHYLYGAPKK